MYKRPRGRGRGRGRGGYSGAGGSGAHAEPPEPEAAPQPPPAAYIRAYEAQLVSAGGRGPIPWAGDESILADRHNLLHLLPDLPSPPPSPSPAASLSSWSSADEEAFDLSGDELEAHARTRRQKWVDGLRATRLAEREAEDAAAVAEREAEAEARRGEEPPPDIAQIMAHTARSLAASPNPALLVSKIMARHAGDARFAFLREARAVGTGGGAGGSGGVGESGRWAGAWARAQADAGVRLPTAVGARGGGGASTSASGASKAGGGGGGGLGGLGGYGSDSSDGTSSEDAPPPPPDAPPPPPPGPPPPSPPH